MRLVIDPGVFVSGLISSKGAPRELLDLVFEGRVSLVVSEHLLEELSDVLAARSCAGTRPRRKPTT